MKAIASIENQQFYQVDFNQLHEFSSNNKCAVIIDEKNLNQLLEKNLNYSKEHLNQVIIINHSLSNYLSFFKDKDILLVTATNIKKAVELVVQSAELNSKVLIFVNIDKAELVEIINSVTS